jgi:SET domain-containing protein
MSSPSKPAPTPAPVIETEWVHFHASAIHGTGGFARKDIPRGTQIIEYLGERIDKAESLRRCEAGNQFIFQLDSATNLDGNVDWNPARFLNHSCAPNCDAELDNGRIWIIARQDIPAGQELTFNYGFSLEDYKEYPCACGAPSCVGYIVAEEFHEHVRRQKQLLNPPPS